MRRVFESSCVALIVALILYTLVHHVCTLLRGTEEANSFSRSN
jgi:hypothetical protein